MRPRSISLVCLVIGIWGAAQSAETLGLDILLNDIGTAPMTAQQLAAFRAAADLWEAQLADPITVSLNIAWDAPDTFRRPTILASTGTARTTTTYSIVKFAMFLDNDSANEFAAITQLSNG